MAIDASGSVYLAGGASDDAFVTKLKPDGSAVAYSTRLGGGGHDRAIGIAVDASGNAFVVGVTSSADFPVVNALQPAIAGTQDAFVAKIDPTGRILFSTYLGGRLSNAAADVAVDTGNNVYVVGTTNSPDFPTSAGSFQRALARAQPCPPVVASDCNDAFIVKLDATGSAMLYSTLVGGNLTEAVSRMAVDAGGHVYVTGFTRSRDFPVSNPLQPDCHPDSVSSCGDAFVVRMNPSGSGLEYATFLGGTGSDFANAIAVDAAGRAVVAGQTDSSDFPTRLAAQSHNAGGPVFRSTTGGATWQMSSAGLEATDVRKVVVSRGVPNTAYAVTRQGVFRGSNSGQSWQTSRNGLTSLDVSDVAADPQTPAIVYAATYGGGVFKSLDAGESWMAINDGLVAPFSSNLFAHAIAIAPASPSTLYLATTSGLFKSLNGGSTWSRIVARSGGDHWAVAVDPRDANTVYATTFEGCWKSRDGGATWGGPVRFFMGAELVMQLLIDPVTPSTLYAGGRSAYRSTDAGATWSTGVGFSVFSASSLALEATSPTTLYAGTVEGLYKSVDGGASWRLQSSALTKAISAVGIDPMRPGVVYAAGYVRLDGFVARISETGSTLGMSTYLGGLHDDRINGVAIGPDGRVWVAGETLSGNFPAIGAIQDGLRGERDAFVAAVTLDRDEREPRVPRIAFWAPHARRAEIQHIH